jgi:hypothetical protein
MRALAKVLNSGFSELKRTCESLEASVADAKKQGVGNPESEELLVKLRKSLDSQKPFMKSAFKKIAKGTVVNCWCANECESEAMWKLYSDSGKGIAIQSRVKLFKAALEDVEENFVIHVATPPP